MAKKIIPTKCATCGKDFLIEARRVKHNARFCGHSCAAASRAKHGQYGTSEHRCWQNIRQRCTDPNGDYWHRYGGRGIKVCDQWQDFKVFLSDMGKKPSPQHSIERIDNDGDYCPENCRWATNIEQHKNKSTNHWVTINGETKIFSDWCMEFGIKPKTAFQRVKMGWSDEKALITPVRKHGKSAPSLTFERWKRVEGA